MVASCVSQNRNAMHQEGKEMKMCESDQNGEADKKIKQIRRVKQVYRVFLSGSCALLSAAECGVSQFVLVSSLGTGKFGFPASLLK